MYLLSAISKHRAQKLITTITIYTRLILYTKSRYKYTTQNIRRQIFTMQMCLGAVVYNRFDDHFLTEKPTDCYWRGNLLLLLLRSAEQSLE